MSSLTYHSIFFRNSQSMKEIITDKSIDLVICSPPYPLIPMWNELFFKENREIENALQRGNGIEAYELMHKELNKTWDEVDRVLKPSGIVCINIGNTTINIGEEYRIYPNHSRIIQKFEQMGYKMLPEIIWHKISNKTNKFLGSGMLPSNAYVTQEHEYILIFRKGSNRIFSGEDRENRYKSAYFWEERNLWFSDIWNDLQGIKQVMEEKNIRERSGAYPFELSYRLINMFSIQGDTILDPFLGTGTTVLSAMALGRNSIGYEIDERFGRIISNNLQEDSIKWMNNFNRERIEKHKRFIEQNKDNLKYLNNNYGLVKTKQEEQIQLYEIESINKIESIGSAFYTISYKKLR